MRVLVFGDSIAQGFWDTEGGWVARLRRHYDERQIKDLRNNDEPTIFNLGVSGGTSKTILARFGAETLARRTKEPMAFLFSTGLNDSYREEPDNYSSTPEEYEERLGSLIKMAKNYSDKIMFVGLNSCEEALTVPASWADVNYTNERIKAFEAIMERAAANSGASFVPVFNEFRKRLDAGEALLTDGLHPNNDGHKLIFELVRPELDKLLAA